MCHWIFGFSRVTDLVSGATVPLAAMDLELPEDVLSDTESLGSQWSDDLRRAPLEDPLADLRAVGAASRPVHFMEIFSNPRIAPKVALLGLRHGPSIDLGTGWNLLLASCRLNLLKLLDILCPLVVMLSPPCTVFSQVQHSMEGRRKNQTEWEKRYDDGLKLWDFACKIFRKQILAGRFAVMEHPWLATSWRLLGTQMLEDYPGVHSTVFDQCLLGLATTVEGKPVRKRTRFLTNMPNVDRLFRTRCTFLTCNHPGVGHSWLQGQEGGVSRCRSAQTYPPEFCRRMALMVRSVEPPAHWGVQAHHADEADEEP